MFPGINRVEQQPRGNFSKALQEVCSVIIEKNKKKISRNGKNQRKVWEHSTGGKQHKLELRKTIASDNTICLITCIHDSQMGMACIEPHSPVVTE